MTDKDFLKGILKQLLLAVLVGSVLLAIYLAAVNSKSPPDKAVGKYAYINTNGNYVGKIKGHGRSNRSQLQVYYIEEPTGDVIEIPMQYIDVRDKSPNER